MRLLFIWFWKLLFLYSIYTVQPKIQLEYFNKHMYLSLIRLEPLSQRYWNERISLVEFQWIPWWCWSCHCRCNCIQSELPTFTNSLRDIHMVHTHTRTHHRTHAEHKSRKIQNHQFDWPVKMFDNPVWILASSVNVNTEQCLKFLSPWLHYVHSAAVDNSTTSNQYTTDLLTNWLTDTPLFLI